MRTAAVFTVIFLMLGECAFAQTKSDDDLKQQRKKAIERFEKAAAEAERLRQLIAQQSVNTDTTEKDETNANAAFQLFSDSNFSLDKLNVTDEASQPKLAKTTSEVFANANYPPTQTTAVESVMIGAQTWTAKNLSTDRFRNGDPIAEARTTEEWMAAHKSGTPAWCYYKNDPSYEATYGRLYNWAAVTDSRGLAPAGWHIPSTTEWDALNKQLGNGFEAGGKLRSVMGWKKSATIEDTNESGFNARPGSCRGIEGTFYQDEETAYWWTSTPFEGINTGYGINLQWGSMLGKNIYLQWGLSVRCVKD